MSRLHLHFDPVGGAAGDMFIAAMLHARPDLVSRVLRDVAAVLPAGIGRASLESCVASGISACRFELVLKDGSVAKRRGAETTYRAMRVLLERADVASGTAEHAAAILHRIAVAEAAVHDIPIDRVHFHEIADWDALMDVTAAGSICAAVMDVTAPSVSLAPLPLGGGLVDTAHGKLPVPAPATALILQGFDWHDDGVPGERVTPTGAAILAHLVELAGGERPPARLKTVGYGAGSRVLPGVPNVLRVSMFERGGAMTQQDTLVQLACDIDDMTGEELGFACTRLREADGVVDLTLFTGQGKKSRPVTRLEMLVRPDAADAVAELCFDVTSTLGLRRSDVTRIILPRVHEETADGLRRKRVRRPAGDTVKVESDDLATAQSLSQRRAMAARGQAD